MLQYFLNKYILNKGCIFRAFKKFSFKEKFDYSNIYPTTHDAVVSILNKNQFNIKSFIKNQRKKSSIFRNIKSALTTTEAEATTSKAAAAAVTPAAMGTVTSEEMQMKSLYVKRKLSSVFDDINGIKIEEENDTKLENIVV